MKRQFRKVFRKFFPYLDWLIFGREPLVFYDSKNRIKEWQKLRADPRKAASRRKSTEPFIDDMLCDLWRPAWFTKWVLPVIKVWLAIGERDGMSIA